MSGFCQGMAELLDNGYPAALEAALFGLGGQTHAAGIDTEGQR